MAGFAGIPQIGFANHPGPPSPGAMARSVSYGKFAAAVGFGADMKRYREGAKSSRPSSSKPKSGSDQPSMGQAFAASLKGESPHKTRRHKTKPARKARRAVRPARRQRQMRHAA